MTHTNNTTLVDELSDRVFFRKRLKFEDILTKYDLSDQEQTIIDEHITQLHEYHNERKNGTPRLQKYRALLGKGVKYTTIGGALAGGLLAALTDNNTETLIGGILMGGIGGTVLEMSYEPIARILGTPKKWDCLGTIVHLHELNDTTKQRLRDYKKSETKN